MRRWLCSRWSRRTIAYKLVISGCVLAIFFHPQIGRLLGAGGSLLWLWAKTED